MSLKAALAHPEKISHETLSSLEDPLYYLHNFRLALDWVLDRYADLLNDDEQRFGMQFRNLPKSSQGLLVRMVMRKGDRFRADKLHYEELGSASQAAQPLLALGWLRRPQSLDLESLFALFTWPELKRMLAEPLDRADLKKARKREALSALRDAGVQTWTLPDQRVYELTVMPLCDRIRLMFFGNPHQDWSEFVLTQLGRLTFEPVAQKAVVRPFQTREELDAYLQIQACREGLHNDESLADVEARIPPASDNPWLRFGRDRLLFKLARAWEREGQLSRARCLYEGCGYPGARVRLLRVLEREGQWQKALALAEKAERAPESEEERQQLHRILPRVKRKLGLPASSSLPSLRSPPTFELCLPHSQSVELAVCSQLHEPAGQVWFVENTLLTGLFGLLCWDAIFAPVPGAFFHPFQWAPADLHWPGFFHRRADRFNRCFRHLREGTYQDVIWHCYKEKWGYQSPFVHWPSLPESLLKDALACIPAEHLVLCFQRLLRDVKANRSGLPDLIQLWPERCQYRLLEVKGPGDRLQDNQQRWLDFFAEHEVPVFVCYVTWDDGA